jgi:hypothetical protein
MRLTPCLAVSLLLAVGCSSYQLVHPEQALAPVGPVPGNVARVCVVRTSVIASLVTFPTRDNGVLVGATRGATHFCYLAQPGHHRIQIEADAEEHAELDAEGGRSYFLKQEVDNVFGYVKCRAVWVDERQGAELLDASSYAILGGVPGTEKLPPQPTYVAAAAR